MKIRIKGNDEFNERQREIETGIYLLPTLFAPKPDPNKEINEKLDKLLSIQRDDTYLTKEGVAELLEVSEKTVDRLYNKAMIPAPKTISPNGNNKGRKILRWKKQEVIDWIDQY